MKKLMTLCIIRHQPKVLQGFKKRGFGAGRWDGFGGKVEEGESIEDAAKRELREEAGLEVIQMSERGVLDFEFESDPKRVEMHIFEVNEFSGEPNETEEMKPEWFDFDEILFDRLWSEDRKS